MFAGPLFSKDGVQPASRAMVRAESGRTDKGQLTQLGLYPGGKSLAGVMSCQGECSRTSYLGCSKLFL